MRSLISFCRALGRRIPNPSFIRDRGVPSDQAEAHAEAARDFIMSELVTKIDLEAALDRVTLRMTVRFGVMLVAGIGVLAALLKLA
jgi:hypothetical protein